MDKYTIDVAAAQAAVSGARGEFDDLYGHEGRIEVAGEHLAQAAEEDKINSALRQAFVDFLKPWTVSLVTQGRNILDAGDSIISEFVTADGKMEDAGNVLKRASIEMLANSVDDVPDYDAGASTSSTSPANTFGGKNSNPSSNDGYEW